MEESASKTPHGSPGQSGEPGTREQQAPTVEPGGSKAVDTVVELPQEREKETGGQEAAVRSGQPSYIVAEEPKISELLMDLSMPVDYLDILTPCIQHLKLDIVHQQQIRNRLTDQNHLFTMITNGWDNRCLLLIPDKVLTDPQPVNILYLKELIELLFDHLERRMKLFILYEINPEAKYKLFLNARVARPMKLTIDYLPCSELRDIRDWDLEDQVDYLTNMISLGDLEAPARPVAAAPLKEPISEMSKPDQRSLTAILAGLDTFRLEKDHRRMLADMVGLNTANFDFDRTESAVAWDLIQLCLTQGFIQAEERHAIDLLMSLVKADGGLATKDKNQIDSILARYDLS